MSKFLRENPLVSQIDFGDNKIKRADMAVLMNVLSSNTNIEKVNLSKGNRKSVFMKVEDEVARNRRIHELEADLDLDYE
jgi:hypothetical protein